MSIETFAPLLREPFLAAALPELWAALLYGDDLPKSPRLVQIVLEGLSRPNRPQDIFRELLAGGELAAAEALFDQRDFYRAVCEGGLEDILRQELTNVRLSQVQEIEARCDLLRQRGRCARIPASHLEKDFGRVRECAAARLRKADALLRSIDEILRTREADQKHHLRRTLVERLAHLEGAGGSVRNWQAQITCELDKEAGQADLCLARWILEAGPGQESEAFAPRRPEWTYSQRPEVVCRWFLGENPPVDFDRWRLSKDDRAAWELLGTLADLVADPRSVTTSMVARFVAALEEWVGSPVRHESGIEEEEGCFFTTTGALFESRIPALTEVGGLPLVVATGAPLASLTRLPVKTFLLFELVATAGKPRWCLSFEPALLFRLLGDGEYSRRNFIRALAAQLPLASIFADRLPAPHPDSLEGREQELAALHNSTLSVVVGPRGIGKTTLLQRAARDLASTGWQTIWLNAATVAGRLMEELGKAHYSARAPDLDRLTTAWCEGLRPDGLFVVIDGGNLTEQPDGGRVIARWLGAITEASGGRIRCALAGPPDLALPGGPFEGITHRRITLGPLGHGSLRTLLADLADILGLAFDGLELLDRLAFYTGGHPTIFYLLLIEMLQRKGVRHQRGRPVIDLVDLKEAWRGEAFRRQSKEILLGAVLRQQHLRIALDCLIQLIEDDEFLARVPRSELEEWLRGEGISAGTLDHLVDEGLAVLENRDVAAKVKLPPSGLGHLITDLFPTSAEHLPLST